MFFQNCLPKQSGYSLIIKQTTSQWHERIESTSFAGRFVRLDPPLLLYSWSYVETYLQPFYALKCSHKQIHFPFIFHKNIDAQIFI